MEVTEEVKCHIRFSLKAPILSPKICAFAVCITFLVLNKEGFLEKQAGGVVFARTKSMCY